jgi:erythritol kinase
MLGDAVQPDPVLQRIYERLYPIYLESRRAMPPIWAALADARTRSDA